MTGNMYAQSRKSINFYVGCEHNCLYCVPSFQRQMKRQRQNCLTCYLYKPHPHLERLCNKPPRTNEDEFIFFPSASDWAFIPQDAGEYAIEYIRRYSDRYFLCQTKDPSCFSRWDFPKNAILAITLETNRDTSNISEAPIPRKRWLAFKDYQHRLKIITIEPILDFDFEPFVAWLKEIKPQPKIYLGYDNHNCHLDEPSGIKTEKLIRILEANEFKVIRKGKRWKAWWELKEVKDERG